MSEEITFKIPFRLPSLNEVIGANRENKYLGAKLKKDVQAKIALFLRGKPITEPCEVYIEWHEENAKRDVDNIQSSQKFILDALVKKGILPNDNQRWVKQIHHRIVQDKTSYVIVRLEIEHNREEALRNQAV